jgi:nucleotide-binding universal stress UspA family protein
MAADLIALATHGRKGVRRMLLGSVAEAVLRDATCPVLTVQRQESEVHLATK